MNNSLQAVLDREIRNPGLPDTSNVQPGQPVETPQGNRRAPSRANTKLIGGHFHPGVAKELKMLAAEEETTIQALLEQALDLLFIKKGRSRIMRD